jgi:hypothetical protein
MVSERLYTLLKRLAIFPSLAGMSLTFFLQRRERWLLLTVKTEVNGDSGSTYERVHSLVGSLSLSCRYKRFLSCLGSSIRSDSKYSSSPYTISIHLSPLPSKLDSQPCWVTCLLVCFSANWKDLLTNSTFSREKMSDKRNPLACELAPTDELVAAR